MYGNKIIKLSLTTHHKIQCYCSHCTERQGLMLKQIADFLTYCLDDTFKVRYKNMILLAIW